MRVIEKNSKPHPNFRFVAHLIFVWAYLHRN